jgi:predicted ester cyclase
VVSADNNKALLEGYLREVWTEGNPDAIDRYVAPNYKRHMSPTSPPLDPATQVERIKGIRAAFPDISIVADDIIADDHGVAFRSTMKGTHLGEILGIPPTGRAIEVGLVDYIRIEDGKFVEQWGGPDMFDLLKQLGASFSVGD